MKPNIIETGKKFFNNKAGLGLAAIALATIACKLSEVGAKLAELPFLAKLGLAAIAVLGLASVGVNILCSAFSAIGDGIEILSQGQTQKGYGGDRTEQDWQQWEKKFNQNQ